MRIATLFSGIGAKDINGYIGIYVVLEDGRIFSYPKKQGNRIDKEGKFLKPQIKRNGYLGVTLQKYGAKKHLRVHRIVAEAFIENTMNKKTVNHIDGNKLNNHVSNLEWATQEENQLHADTTGLNRLNGINNPRFKKWWFSKGGVTNCPNITIKEWCLQNSFDESTIYRMIKESRTAKSGKLVGYLIGFSDAE